MRKPCCTFQVGCGSPVRYSWHLCGLRVWWCNPPLWRSGHIQEADPFISTLRMVDDGVLLVDLLSCDSLSLQIYLSGSRSRICVPRECIHQYTDNPSSWKIRNRFHFPFIPRGEKKTTNLCTLLLAFLVPETTVLLPQYTMSYQARHWRPRSYPHQTCPDHTHESFPTVASMKEETPQPLPQMIRAVTDSQVPPQGRTLIICLDGTGDKFDSDNSNVVNFVACLKKDDSKQVTVS